MDKGIHIGGWGQIQGSNFRTISRFIQFFAFSKLCLSGFSNRKQNGKLVGINRLMSTDISPCWRAGIQVTVSARMVGIAQLQTLSTLVLQPEAMEP
jgi:hypothetical protein